MHKFVVTVIMILDAVSIKTTRVVVNMKTPLSHRFFSKFPNQS